MAAFAIAAVTTVINLLDKVLQCVKNMSNGVSANIEDVKQATEGLIVRVDQVREIAYETYDAITQFLHHVPQHCHGHWFTKTCHDVAHFFKDFVPLRQFSSRMKAIERKLNDILRLDAFRIGTFGATSSSSAGIRAYSFSRNDHLLVGIEENKKALLSHVCSEESKDMVISVIEDVGSSKTTLIREVYQMIKENFNCNAWVSILPSHEGLLENLWEALCLPVEPTKTKMKRLHSYLQSKVTFLFLMVFGPKIIPDNNLGGRILISTCNRNFASYHARSSDCFYDLKLLTEFGSWQLFCNKTFGNDRCPDLLVDCFEKIVKRSEGSPHVIVVVSNFLSKKPHTLIEFQNVHDSLKYESGDHVGHSYYSILSTSYYQLSSILKYCFLPFHFFP
ncbi:disease resistance protein rpm1 [Quercus suber]|uniref:Disease resistance protein rpm1 n=1 Tax=Quercus suber TaxID=58331 RepID=A0AAW0IE77_QUESU